MTPAGGKPIGDLAAFEVAGEAEVGSPRGDDHGRSRASSLLRKKDGERGQIGRAGARYLGSATGHSCRVEIPRAGSIVCSVCAPAKAV